MIYLSLEADPISDPACMHIDQVLQNQFIASQSHHGVGQYLGDALH